MSQSSNVVALQPRNGPVTETDTFVLQPRLLGIGRDRLIGGASGPAYRRIDLRLLSHPVAIDWSGPDSGSISDGADCIVFQGIEEILLPACMAPPALPPAVPATVA